MSVDEKAFYVEWCHILGDYSKGFYEKMKPEELKHTYLELVGERE
jgi:hypothetical protein